MRHPSIRGIGIRYMLALTLPITGVVLVLYTVAQLFGSSVRDRRAVSVPPAPSITGSTASARRSLPLLHPTHQIVSPKK